MEAHRITDPKDAARFITGGKAYFTLRSARTGTRYTYRVKASDDGKVHFASVMYGSDNNTQYTYMGMIKDRSFGATAKSKVEKTDPRFKAFDFAFHFLVKESKMPTELEFWHEGRCACCGRRLTVPESIQNGIGPECMKRFK